MPTKNNSYAQAHTYVFIYTGLRLLQCKADDDPQKVPFLVKEDMPVELQPFRNAMLDRLRRLFSVFGGPEQYLAWRFYATEDLQAFSTWLSSTFPPDPYSSYVSEVPPKKKQ